VVSRAGAATPLPVRYHVELVEPQPVVSVSATTSWCFSNTRPEDSTQRAGFRTWHGAGRGVDGIPLRRLRADAFRLSRQLGLVPQQLHRRGLVREQHLAAERRRCCASRIPRIRRCAGCRTPCTSSPSEWYRWEKDLRQNPDIDILLSDRLEQFPARHRPKPHEIWHSGYYPVVWTNRKYRMIYFNFGHNDIGLRAQVRLDQPHAVADAGQSGAGSADLVCAALAGDEAVTAS
jgi:hypothetical protein